MMPREMEARKPPALKGESRWKKTSLVLDERTRIDARHFALDHRMTLGEIVDAALRAYITAKK